MRLGRALLIRAVKVESVKAIAERARLSKQAVSALANGDRVCPLVDTAIALFEAVAIPVESWGAKFEDVAVSKSTPVDAGHGTDTEEANEHDLEIVGGAGRIRGDESEEPPWRTLARAGGARR